MIVSKGEHQTSNGGNISMALKESMAEEFPVHPFFIMGGFLISHRGYPPNQPKSSIDDLVTAMVTTGDPPSVTMRVTYIVSHLEGIRVDLVPATGTASVACGSSSG